MSAARRLTSRALAAAVAAAALAGCTGGEPSHAATREASEGALPAGVRPTPAPPARWAVGRAPAKAAIAAWDIDVGPDGRDLPAGRGTYAEGARLFATKCASCHGAKGEGTGQGAAAFPRLVGREPRDGFPFGRDPKYVKTVGNYWPYATTLYDYVRRAMPLTAPGSLSNDETYALVAWLLAENEIVPRGGTMDAAALRRVVMPARGHFVPDDRRGGAEVR